MNIQDCWYQRKCTNKCNENCLRYKLMYALFRQSQLPESLWKYKDLTACDNGDVQSFMKLKDISDNILDFINRLQKDPTINSVDLLDTKLSKAGNATGSAAAIEFSLKVNKSEVGKK